MYIYVYIYIYLYCCKNSGGPPGITGGNTTVHHQYFSTCMSRYCSGRGGEGRGGEGRGGGEGVGEVRGIIVTEGVMAV